MADTRANGGEKPRLWVEDAGGRRPFMRGILVHSLLSRGASFEQAYRAAGEIRDRLHGRDGVRRAELSRMVESLAAEMFDGGLEPRAPQLPRPIRVQGDKKSAPFSKGVMAQSLLAAAIAPDEAFSIAQELEARLLARGVRKITRDELRAETQRGLEAAGDAHAMRRAARYRNWRRFRASGRPMVLLLAGAAGVGKSVLAREIAHRLGVARVSSTDAIRQVMRLTLSRELVPALHASSYDAYRAVGKGKAGAEEIVAAFREQAATVAVGVRAMVARAVEENADIIVEGVSILPDLLPELLAPPARGGARIIFLAVAAPHKSAFKRRFAARAQSAPRPKHRYLQNLNAILHIQDHIMELAERHEIPIVKNEEDAFDASVLSILRHVAEALRGAPEAKP